MVAGEAAPSSTTAEQPTSRPSSRAGRPKPRLNSLAGRLLDHVVDQARRCTSRASDHLRLRRLGLGPARSVLACAVADWATVHGKRRAATQHCVTARPGASSVPFDWRSPHLGGSMTIPMAHSGGVRAFARPSREEGRRRMGSVTAHLPPAVVVRDLHVRFGDVEAVDGVDLEAHAGQATALLGRNGAGKSTTMRVLAGVVPADRRHRDRGRPRRPRRPDARSSGAPATAPTSAAWCPGRRRGSTSSSPPGCAGWTTGRTAPATARAVRARRRRPPGDRRLLATAWAAGCRCCSRPSTSPTYSCSTSRSTASTRSASRRPSRSSPTPAPAAPACWSPPTCASWPIEVCGARAGAARRLAGRDPRGRPDGRGGGGPCLPRAPGLTSSRDLRALVACPAGRAARPPRRRRLRVAGRRPDRRRPCCWSGSSPGSDPIAERARPDCADCFPVGCLAFLAARRSSPRSPPAAAASCCPRARRRGVPGQPDHRPPRRAAARPAQHRLAAPGLDAARRRGLRSRRRPPCSAAARDAAWLAAATAAGQVAGLELPRRYAGAGTASAVLRGALVLGVLAVRLAGAAAARRRPGDRCSDLASPPGGLGTLRRLAWLATVAGPAAAGRRAGAASARCPARCRGAATAARRAARRDRQPPGPPDAAVSDFAALLRIDRASVLAVAADAPRPGRPRLCARPGRDRRRPAVDPVIVLPGLVASGGALLFGVNAWCLDARGALWRESLPVSAGLAFTVRANVLAEFLLAASLLTVAARPRSAPAYPTLAELTRAGLHPGRGRRRRWWSSASMRWSAAAAVRRGPAQRAGHAGPAAADGRVLGRLAVTTTLISLVFSGLARAAGGRSASPSRCRSVLVSLLRLAAPAGPGTTRSPGPGSS